MGYYFSTPTSEAGYKIRQFLHQVKFEHKNVEKAFRLNKNVLIPFMKEYGLKFMEMNPRYKGINTADLQNCYTILEEKESWNAFRKWCKLQEHLKMLD